MTNIRQWDGISSRFQGGRQLTMESLGLHKNATNSTVATDPQYTYICSILESEQPASLDPILSQKKRLTSPD